MTAPPTFVGIDVAKAELVVAVRPSGARWSVPNDDQGIEQLVRRLRQLAPTLLVLEATGGYERAAVAALAAAGVPLVVANPRPSPRLRARHRPVRQNGPDRRPHASALCRARPARAAPIAR